ncbi:hypothetical protein [Streptomonospora salina]|uniref:Uncharacterized protein n=1 Tax=Streptomonospora salina TaxID=104205 RepID=A0A841EFM6_9ACTN|nr:hypothetical protein [Streptomonospora salina]MBB6000129.1 hypothetical protein [Streptomonospora salina]
MCAPETHATTAPRRSDLRLDLDTSGAETRPGHRPLPTLEVAVDGRTVYPAPSVRDVMHLALEAAGFTAADCDLAGGCWAIAVPGSVEGIDGELWISDEDASIDYPISEHEGWLVTWNPGGFEGAMAGESRTIYESACTDAIADTRRVIAALKDFGG